MIDDVTKALQYIVLRDYEIKVNDIKNEIDNNGIIKKFSTNDDDMFKYHTLYELEGHFLSVTHGAKFKRDEDYGIFINFKCSKFDSFSDVMKWLELILGNYFELFINDSVITRLDPCIETTDFTLDYIYTSCRRVGSRQKSRRYYGYES